MNEYLNKHIKCFNPSTEDRNLYAKQRIYHYTSPRGLYSILDNSTIRFTDCQFLNDKSEYTHIKKPLIKAFEEMKKDLHNDFESSVMDLLNNNFEQDDIKIAGKSSKLSLQFIKKRYYVFCSSTTQDSLGMWNYYVKGGNYQGYNIGLSISKLLDCFSTITNPEIDVFYGKVIYKERDQINLLKDLLLKADQDLEDKLRQATSSEDIILSEQEIIGEVLTFIENYRLFFKDEAFSNEKEYRFVLKLPLEFTPNESDPISIGFDVKNGVFTPFCVLSIRKENTIDSIMLSPMLESELAEQGLKRYLKLQGFSSITIGQSKVPIRY
jgi:hypothetical protein